MLDIIFNNIIFYTLSSLSTFFIIFDVTIHLDLGTDHYFLSGGGGVGVLPFSQKNCSQTVVG